MLLYPLNFTYINARTFLPSKLNEGEKKESTHLRSTVREGFVNKGHDFSNILVC